MLEIDDDGIPKFTTAESYEQFALNVEGRTPERARKARKLAVQLRAEDLSSEYGATSEVELKCLEAMCAYEWTLFKKHGRRQKASYLRRVIKKDGIISAVESAVSKDQETVSYGALVAEGMQEMLFEAVVVANPGEFSEVAVEKSTKRLRQWQAGD